MNIRKSTKKFLSITMAIIFMSLIFQVSLFAPKNVYASTSPQISYSNFSGGGFEAAAYGNNTYVAVGNKGATAVSSDALTWSCSTPNDNFSFSDVTFGKNLFVAVGQNGIIKTSSDGVNWASQSSGTSVYLDKIIYTGTEFYTVGYSTDTTVSPSTYSGVVLKSTDGVNWTSVNIGATDKPINSIAYGNSIIAITDYTGNVYCSSNSGSSWSKTTNIGDSINFITFLHDRFYIGTTGAYLYYSSNASTWTNVGDPFRSVPTGACSQPFCGLYDGSKYYFFGFDLSFNYYGGIMTSTNGTSFTSQSSSENSTMNATGCLYANGKYIQCGGQGIRVSTDGINWKYAIINGSFNSVIFDGSNYIAVGNTAGSSAGSDGTIYKSSDFSHWTMCDLPLIKTLKSVAYGNGKYVAVGASYSGSDGQIEVSSDSTNWQQYTPPSTGCSTLNSIVYAHNLFVAVGGSGGIITSPDGQNWTAVHSGSTYTLNSVDYINGQFVACGSKGEILYSTDGTNWTEKTFGDTTVTFYGVAYGNSQYVLVGGRAGYGLITTSPDLSTFSTPQIDNSLSNYKGVKYHDGSFVATANAHTTPSTPSNSSTEVYLAVSSDGTNWTKTDCGFTNWVYGINYVNNKFGVVGYNGLALSANLASNASYTVTYNGNGNTSGTVPIDSNSYIGGTSVTSKDSGELVKTGYTFAGWNTAQDGTGTAVAAGGNFSISKNTTLYAQWTEVSPLPQVPYYISTIAGTGTPSYSGDGGAARSAELNSPTDVALDSSGDIYIADYISNVIRKIDTSGNISTIAGIGTATGTEAGGYSGDGGAGTSAQLNYPLGVAVDSIGNIYIADTNNSVIRKVDTSGKISTIAGTGTAGYSGDGGAATSAKLNNPSGVAVDSSGNIYIADTYNGAIRKIDTSGKISTIAGMGTNGYGGDGGAATSARLNYPSGVAVDSIGNIYIADTSNSVIRKIDTSGKISTIAGMATGSGSYGGDGGAATSARLNYPSGVAVDSIGNIYIADTGSSEIRKVDTSGKISTIAGMGTNGYSGDGQVATNAKLNNPSGVAVDSIGNIYIADTYNNVIRKLSPVVSSYTVTYNGNGNTSGTVPIDSNSYTGGTSVTSKDSGDLVKTGYTFAGWNTAQDGTGTAVAAGGNFSIAENTTLYAQWTEIVPASLSTNTAGFDKNVSNQVDISVGMMLNGNTLTSITNGVTPLVNGIDYTVNGNLVTINKSYLSTLSTGMSTLVFYFSAGNPQGLNVTVTDTTPVAASGLTVTTVAETPAVSGKINLTVTPQTEDGNHKVYYRIVDSNPTALNVGDAITPSDWIEVTDANAHEITVPNGKYVEAVEVTTADNKVTKWGKSGATNDGYIPSASLSINTASFDKNISNQADVSIGMTLNGNTLTSITNGVTPLVSGMDYTVNVNTVTINKGYLASLGTGTVALVFNFSAGNPQSLNVTVTDTTPIAASGLTVTTVAETPAVLGKVDLTVTPAAVESNHKVYYRIVNAAPTALNVGDVITASDWTEVTDANAHEITVQNGKYIEAVEVSTADNKVTKWGKSSATVDGYTAPVSSSLSTNTVNFDKNTSNQADVSIGMTLKGNTLTSITNGTYTLANGTDYTASGSLVTIKKSYLASLSTGVSPLVFNFSAGSSQSLSVIISDSTPGNASLSTNTANFDKNTANQADVNVGMTISQNTLTSITNSGTSLVQGTDYTISGNTVSIKKSSLGKLSTGTSTVLFNSSTGSSQNLTAAISLDQTGANLTMELNGDALTSITNEGNTLVNGTDYIVNGNTVTIKRGFLTKVGTGTVKLVFNFGTQKLAVTISANQTAVNVTMAVNENTLTSITNGIYTLVNGIDYTVNGNTVTIKKGYLGTLNTGMSALVFNFSQGSSQSLNVTVTDTTPIAASGLTVTVAAETPAVSGKVNLTVTPAADSNHKVYYRIVNAVPTALNVGDVITPSDWTEVTNAHEITVQNGKYIEAVEVSTADNKVTKWGKSSATADGYIAPVSSSLSTNTSSFDKNTANQADVSIGMTLNGNALTSITNGTYTLVKGTDYTVNGNTVTIKKGYLASLSTGTTALVFNFSEGSPQTLNVTVTDTTPGTYTATFKNYDGSTIGSQTVVSGSKITEPAAPVRTGYTFGGWYKEAACQNKWDFANNTVTSAVTLYAKWTINSYTVTFEDYDGTIIGTPETVNYGGNAVAPVNPTRTGYVFAGWDKNYSNVTANLVVTATYTSGNTYDFPPSPTGNSGETEISTDYLKSKDNTLVITDPAANLSIPASAIDLTNVNGADHIKVTEKVVTPQTNTVQGLFTNLPSNVKMIGSPLNLNVQMFDARDTLIKDIHQFANNQKVKVTIKLTAAQIAGLDTSKLSMYYYDETTSRWVEIGGSFDLNTREFTFYTPHFTNFAIMAKVPAPTPIPIPTVSSHTVTFEDYDGRIIGTPQTVNDGESAIAPANPTRAGYTFTGWDKSYSNVTGDLVIKATYAIENTYKFPAETLVITNDETEVSIPAGSIEPIDGAEYIKVTEKVDNNVEEDFGNIPNGLKTIGNPLLISIDLFDANNNFIEEVHKLANNQKIKVTMKLTADQIKGINPSVISMYYYDETAKAWLQLDGSFDSKTMEITFYMTSL